jgi:hypothetical protein
MKITRGTKKPSFQRMKGAKLPRKPSALIRLALKDLVAAEKVYGIDMFDWVVPAAESAKGKCTVCLAGAVMVGTLKMKPEYQLPINAGPDATTLEAINDLRQGELAEAFDHLYLFLPPHFMDSVDIVEYGRNRKLFKKQMAELADAFEAEGY